MTMRYHPKHDFTRGMVKMTWVKPEDVVLRIGQPMKVGETFVAPVVKKKPKRRGRYERV